MEKQVLDEAPIWSDMRTFDGAKWRGLVDGIIGGYPCQGFSLAGKMRGKLDERNLADHAVRLVREARPRWFFFENVGNHLRIGFRDVKSELEKLHYRVEAGLFSAEQMGAPHKRERLFIFGFYDRNWEEYVSVAAHKGLSRALREYEHASAEYELVDNDRKNCSHLESSKCERPRGRSVRFEPDKDWQPETEITRPGSELGDSTNIYGERRDAQRYDARQGKIGSSSLELPIFPPRQNEYEKWERVISEFPEIEPALRRVANEFPSQVDAMEFREERLRAL